MLNSCRFRERLAGEEDMLVNIGSDQTSLHNPYNGGYYPAGLSFDEANRMMTDDPEKFKKAVQTRYSFHPQWKYSPLIQYNLKIKIDLTLKKRHISSSYSLNFGIYPLHFNKVFSDIYLKFVKMSKIGKKPAYFTRNFLFQNYRILCAVIIAM